MTTLRTFAAMALLFGFAVLVMRLLLDGVREGEDPTSEVDDPAP